jgi:uncharacterized membrane protein
MSSKSLKWILKSYFHTIQHFSQGFFASYMRRMFSKGLSMHQVKGFIFSCVIVVIVFVISSIAAGLFADLVGIWKKPVIGSIAAFFVVITGYVTAPSHKQTSAIIWLIVGAIAAWVLAGNSYYPEDSAHVYQTTIIPLIATYLSGLGALLLCMVWHKKYNKN